MTRTAIATLLGLAIPALGTGCKADKPAEADPRVKTELETCEKHKVQKDELITALQDENARLQRKLAGGGGGGGNEIAVVIENSVLTVRPGAAVPGEAAPAQPVDRDAALAASNEFIGVVTKSRGAIQKCYEQALKRNAGLQAKSLTLTVSATFSAEGAHQSSSFAPSLGDAFDTCIRAVAAKWKLPPNLPIKSFRAPVSLTPS